MASLFEKQINIKQIDPHTYSAESHEDWAIGPVLLGASVAAVVHAAAHAHLNTTLSSYKQPDLHTLHIEFLHPCLVDDFSIKITDLKVGRGTSFIQLHLSQDEEVKVVALATSTNFDQEVGPTAKTDWALSPAPKPIPDFQKIEARKPEVNWIPLQIIGEIVPLTNRLTFLHPRGGYPVDGCIDTWHTFEAPERITSHYLPLLIDLIPSPTETILNSGGEYDARDKYSRNAEWAIKNPGVPARFTHTLESVMKKTIFETTTTMDLEFKGRLPEAGLGWVFTRTCVKMFKAGRLDLDVTICDDQMSPVCCARQIMLSHDTARRFRSKGKSSSAAKL